MGRGGAGLAAVAGALPLPGNLQQTKQAYDVRPRGFGGCSW
ncbi:hypothetical protein [Sporomusa sphaeroides]|nr:hypothetical protein [Sporomusa sphaeroides]